MDWMELSIVVNHEVEYDAIDILENNGSNGVVVEDSKDLIEQPTDKFGGIYQLNPDDYPTQGVRLKAYFNELAYNDLLRSKIKNEIINLDELKVNIFTFEEKEIAESDWANEWKNYFHSFRASKQFTIVPSWESYEKTNEDELCIELDPGMAFGTGDHPTTSMCLKAIETYVKSSHSVIDVGTGSGILSIASHLLGVQRIKALDIDEMAVSVSKDNFKKNHCDQAIEAVPGNLLQGEHENFDIVIANILAHIIEEMIEDAYNTLNEEGYFITSGIIEEKSKDIESHMKRVGFHIISIEHNNGWICIVGQKVSG
ncbi:50S ribosomal protein L11 methyltransferase [Staphylococcus saccharolyticus]|uniref:50S ribosomal protein L11 methyltransferase n=1 Tax=Staphylococcus saccharolyticus TaxID=33028 RepID=UPI00102D8829|nr:50S ribosomal protein L11 methyltransferase [Staphylococcus saccharolyticus]MBL7573319.1 50S ribosomal protein L11 methyltransferase [Staphylococcus saccharolyticus]MBL7583746.1 50S ribosomal protein L11 methyltransferase [Staphylococcus saccharolyticus]MBL7638936.1 50S ribosomal protein L11 methyltransferase [Staphylococcus saccharolyticus]QRJ67590.1 50S ribosomal protein L11 methyltransferase [Staphylococcus saccharolyticus]TAA93847.1 50S ribosomal protein L11 methyltransferase [Staphyloc